MKCPNCDHLLQISERHTVEIDYCPGCRGVWLDKGELDKIIDFSNQQISLLSKKKVITMTMMTMMMKSTTDTETTRKK